MSEVEELREQLRAATAERDGLRRWVARLEGGAFAGRHMPQLLAAVRMRRAAVEVLRHGTHTLPPPLRNPAGFAVLEWAALAIRALPLPGGPADAHSGGGK